MRFVTMLVLLFAIGCSSTPKKIILISINPAEENWYSPLQEIEIQTIHKGVVIYSPWIDLEVGKIGKGIRLEDRFDYNNPTKRIWGFRFVKRFFTFRRAASKVDTQS